MDLLNVSHAYPHHASDGVSLLPLLTGDVSPTAPRATSRPLCFALTGQATCIDNDLKVIRAPVALAVFTNILP